MLRFLVTRILQSIPVLMVMSSITFVIIQAPPGDYGDFIRAIVIVQGGATPEAATAAANASCEANVLNDPMVLQYGRWIWGILVLGDFCMSYAYNKPVLDVVMQRLPATIAIALTCHLLESLLGISFGILAAVQQYTWVDTVLTIIACLGMTIPRLLLALIILYILAYKLSAQEIGSFYPSKFGGQAYWLGWFNFNRAKLWNLIQHIWPVILVATIGGMACNMRVMRANLLDTLNAQYVESVRVKRLG